jgi:sugar phosphate isomerase/epimerase
MTYSRREVGKIALASLALPHMLGSRAFAADSKINGVQIGAITYSFNSIAANPNDIIAAFKQIGLTEVELMSNHAEALAGLPPMPNFGRGRGATGAGGRAAAPGAAAPGVPPPPPAPPSPPPAATPPVAPQAGAPPAGGAGGQGRGGRGGGTPLTPEQTAERDAATAAQAKWRASVGADAFKAVTKKFKDAGIEVRLLTYNMGQNTTDEQMEYAFTMAKALGAKGITTSTQVSMAKRIGPFADKHKLPVGFHGHDATDRPDEMSTEQTFETVMAVSKYIYANLDIGHYTAANGDPVAFLRKHHARITNLHLKDRKRDHGANVPWGQGDTPIKEVLQLLKKEKWDIPANIEFEYGGDAIVEVTKCFDLCREYLK